MSTLEIEQSAQAQALFSLLDEAEKETVRVVLRRVDSARLMPEQSLLIELNVLERLLADVKNGQTIAALIPDPALYADQAIREIGEEVRQQRHIGTLMAGLAICAIVLLVFSIYDIVRGLIAGSTFMDCLTSLDVGHVICFIGVLAGTRFFVMGDKREDYNEKKRAQHRTQLVGFLFIVAFIGLLASVFASLPVVITVPSVYTVVIALVLLVLWKLIGRL